MTKTNVVETDESGGINGNTRNDSLSLEKEITPSAFNLIVLRPDYRDPYRFSLARHKIYRFSVGNGKKSEIKYCHNVRITIK